MWHDAHDAYLESRVMSASPVELVGMIYQTATSAVRDARRHLAEGETLERARAISRASNALIELTTVLDLERGGEIAARLAQLYDYMLRRLQEANLRQLDEPLTEVLGLLATVSEAWDQLARQAQPPVQMETPWAHSLAAEPAPVEAHAWSF
jgi:flagellar secretion chaperone FliS